MNPSSVLRSDAPPFEPKCTDKHCLFLTFSNGFPLTESQIFGLFNWMYPGKVADVYVHRPRPIERQNRPSLFAKVIFNDIRVPELVMGSNEKVSFLVDGLPLYRRRFIEKKAYQTESSSRRDN